MSWSARLLKIFTQARRREHTRRVGRHTRRTDSAPKRILTRRVRHGDQLDSYFYSSSAHWPGRSVVDNMLWLAEYGATGWNLGANYMPRRDRAGEARTCCASSNAEKKMVSVKTRTSNGMSWFRSRGEVRFGGTFRISV